ncbi:MAG: ABC transporter substrate-binding protein [Candidatus Bathyarchaeia archaeon]
MPTEIKIGFVNSLSGPFAVMGVYSQRGVEIGVKWINDRGGISYKGKKIPVRLIYYDDESNTDYTIRLTEKLIVEDKVHVLILRPPPFNVMAMVPIAERHKVVSIGGTGNDAEYQQGFKYMIQTSPHMSASYKTALRMIREVDPEAKTIAFMVSSEDIGGFTRKSVQETAQKYGFEIIFDVTYPTDITDASPMLREIAALKPDIILGACYGPSSWIVMTQTKDLRVYTKWMSIDSIAVKADFGLTYGKWAVGIFAESVFEPEVKWDIIAAREGKEYIGPTSNEILMYWSAASPPGERIRPEAVQVGLVPVIIAAKCIETAQSLDSDKIIDAALHLDVYTAIGKFKLDPTNPAHQVGFEEGYPLLTQWQRKDDKLVYAIVYPYEFATAKAISMPTWEEKETWPELKMEFK